MLHLAVFLLINLVLSSRNGFNAGPAISGSWGIGVAAHGLEALGGPVTGGTEPARDGA